MTGSTLYIVSAPSGAGKTSLVNALIENTSDIRASVSHTTRPPRPGEQNGVHYHFISQAEFEQMRAEENFLEHAQVFDNYYGTSRQWVRELLDAGTDVILEIDWQGARQVRTRQPDCVSIFILPPSRQALEERLRGRGQDSDAVIARRMRDAINEIRHHEDFDYLVVNDNFTTALTDLQAIVRSRRLLHPVQRLHIGELLTEYATG
ncbi:MAG: guanylate kinase [Gammaproteobacteria bacterium]|nr:guanylate kinase [Gammaproteobacteria bacterium]